MFPCWFGSALKLTGVDEFLAGLARYAPRPVYPEDFAARVYKIGRDPQGVRLTYMKITGGSLRVKGLLSGADARGERWEEKAEQLRVYSGEKFRTLEEAEAGTVCAVAGLTAGGAFAGYRQRVDGAVDVPPLTRPQGAARRAVSTGYIGSIERATVKLDTRRVKVPTGRAATAGAAGVFHSYQRMTVYIPTTISGR